VWRQRLGKPALEVVGTVAQALGFSKVLQFRERVILDLTYPLAGDVEHPPDLVQRPRMLASEAVPELEYLPLAMVESAERAR
jgi:hypothetical protein